MNFADCTYSRHTKFLHIFYHCYDHRRKNVLKCNLGQNPIIYFHNVLCKSVTRQLSKSGIDFLHSLSQFDSTTRFPK